MTLPQPLPHRAALAVAVASLAAWGCGGAAEPARDPVDAKAVDGVATDGVAAGRKAPPDEPREPSEPSAAVTAGPPPAAAPEDDVQGPPRPAHLNLLRNASFEEDGKGWYLLPDPRTPIIPFSIADEGAQGEQSVRLVVESGKFDGIQGLCGATQDVEVEELPRTLRGVVRIDEWERGTDKQYVEVIVVCEGPSDYGLLSHSQAEVSFVLVGVGARPQLHHTRRYEIAGPRNPKDRFDGWREFELDLHEAFAEHWKRVPESIRKLRVQLNARFDSPVAEGEARMDVLFDDLYLGG